PLQRAHFASTTLFRSDEVQAEVELGLPGGETLPRHRLERLQRRVVVRRADMLDVPRPAARGMHDLYRPGPRGGLHGALFIVSSGDRKSTRLNSSHVKS